MCGIAGFFHKSKSDLVADKLIRMCFGIQHRGPDSTGISVYRTGDVKDDVYNAWIYIEKDVEKAVGQIDSVFKANNVDVLQKSFFNNFAKYVLKFDGDVRTTCYLLNDMKGVDMLGLGKCMDIYKSLGSAYDLEKNFNLSKGLGSHGIGHVRLATESNVDVKRSHPFWAFGFSDIAIVHNGQLTNYYKLRRMMESNGLVFRTDNDSELISIYCSYMISKGLTLEETLEHALDTFDGCYTFIVTTPNSMGYCKDKLGVKPLLIYEDDDYVAMASEEVALHNILKDKNFKLSEPPKGSLKVWHKN